MRFLPLLLFSGILYSQTTTFSVSGPANARPGTTVNVSVNASGTTNTGTAAAQWNLDTPAGYTKVATIGTQAEAAGKQITCNAAVVLCIVYGLNMNVISNGQFASYAVTIPANAPPGPVNIPLSGVVAATPNGTAVTTALGPTYSILILAKTDIDGNGITNTADVTAMITQIVGATCINDQNNDGVCDARDVQLVIKAATGN